MSKRAEEAALKAYPNILFPFTPLDLNAYRRGAFINGYETAEKDLAPLIEAATIVYEDWNGGTMDDVRKAMAELGKRFKEAKK